MVGEARKSLKTFADHMTKDAKRLRYFYINGKLHKLLHVSRPTNQVLAWCYSEHCKKMYQWSQIKKEAEVGYTPQEVAEMLQRARRTIINYHQDGLIKKPEMTYDLETGKVGKRIFSESDIRKLHAFLLTQHKGRPRLDGMVVPAKTLTKEELEAKLKHGINLYTKTSEGRFVPVYEAENW